MFVVGPVRNGSETLRPMVMIVPASLPVPLLLISGMGCSPVGAGQGNEPCGGCAEARRWPPCAQARGEAAKASSSAKTSITTLNVPPGAPATRYGYSLPVDVQSVGMAKPFDDVHGATGPELQAGSDSAAGTSMVWASSLSLDQKTR